MRQLRWQTPKLLYVGSVAEAIQGGGGKLTADMGDPGEPKKVPSTG
jgi:hypothetical protein